MMQPVQLFNKYTVSLFGHREISNYAHIEKRLEVLIKELLLKHEYVEFLIGRDGEFDILAAAVIKRCKRKYRADNSDLVWVMPYILAEFRDNEESYLDYYDIVEFADKHVHFKSAHQYRNRQMVDRSNLVVFCVEHESGGAYKTMQYAEKNNANFINIFNDDFEI